MYHGRNTGKKTLACRIVKHAFDIIALMTGRNPIEVFIKVNNFSFCFHYTLCTYFNFFFIIDFGFHLNHKKLVLKI